MKEEVIGNDGISEIQAKSAVNEEADLEEDDDVLEDLDRFIEGQDTNVDSHQDMFVEDEKLLKR